MVSADLRGNPHFRDVCLRKAAHPFRKSVNGDNVHGLTGCLGGLKLTPYGKGKSTFKTGRDTGLSHRSLTLSSQKAPGGPSSNRGNTKQPSEVFSAAVVVRPLNCIDAVSQNTGIGKNGDLPWPRLRREYRYFQRMTTTSSVEGKQNLVIMGRKTWFSVPEKNQTLKDRINIVLSRELKEPPQGAHFLATSLDDALKLIEQPELTNKVDMVWIVGGSSVYTEAMSRPGHLRLFVTRIMQGFESDTFFPEIDLEKYKLLPEYPGVPSDVQEEKGIKYKFEVYEKNN
ncbi:dihydrofolate reductase-like [Balaenoptera acutorostrata]|uniref:Dihydrofolate reductase n=1 Tax=Balaenoptera acutorostrata TaxID=9767 RepID=A0ABM3U1V8_BALAC|nr:dihydrofolate reductase-like [Balaenoptera acutorostrata]